VVAMRFHLSGKLVSNVSERPFPQLSIFGAFGAFTAGIFASRLSLMSQNMSHRSSHTSVSHLWKL
jgi:hypothetical protein